MAERGYPYACYVGRVWRYQRDYQNLKIEQSTVKMTSNDQHQSLPISALSIIGVWTMKGL